MLNGAPLTPAQHYLAAEELLHRRGSNGQHQANLLLAAQVHATLAATTGSYADAYDRWRREQEEQ